MKTIIALILFGFSMAAFAGTASTRDFTWAVPTSRADGTALSQSELGPYVLACGDAAGSHSKYSTHITDASPYGQETVDMAFLGGPGTYYCVMRAVDMNGLTSADSNEFKVTLLPTSPPKAPTNITVAVASP